MIDDWKKGTYSSVLQEFGCELVVHTELQYTERTFPQ